MVATRIGLEPTTPSVTGWCSNQLSYRAMIAQVRAAVTAGTCPIIPEDGRLVKRKKQKSRKKDEKGGLPQSVHPRGLNSLSQNLMVLPAPSGREPLALPETLRFSRKLYRHAKGPISEGAGIERSEMTGGVSSAATPKQPDRPGGAVWLRGLILPASCWRGPPLRRADRRRPAGASCRRGWGNRWAG